MKAPFPFFPHALLFDCYHFAPRSLIFGRKCHTLIYVTLLIVRSRYENFYIQDQMMVANFDSVVGMKNIIKGLLGHGLAEHLGRYEFIKTSS